MRKSKRLVKSKRDLRCDAGHLCEAGREHDGKTMREASLITLGFGQPSAGRTCV